MKRKTRENGGSRIARGVERVQGGDTLDVERELSRDGSEPRHPELEALVRRQLELVDEDPEREGLRETPMCVARSLRWLTQG